MMMRWSRLGIIHSFFATSVWSRSTYTHLTCWWLCLHLDEAGSIIILLDRNATIYMVILIRINLIFNRIWARTDISSFEIFSLWSILKSQIVLFIVAWLHMSCLIIKILIKRVFHEVLLIIVVLKHLYAATQLRVLIWSFVFYKRAIISPQIKIGCTRGTIF